MVKRPVGSGLLTPLATLEEHSTNRNRYAQGNNRIKHHQSFPIKATRDVTLREPVVTWNVTDLNFDTLNVSAHYLPTWWDSTTSPNYIMDREPIDLHRQNLSRNWSPKQTIYVSVASVFDREF